MAKKQSVFEMVYNSLPNEIVRDRVLRYRLDKQVKKVDYQVEIEIVDTALPVFDPKNGFVKQINIYFDDKKDQETFKKKFRFIGHGEIGRSGSHGDLQKLYASDEESRLMNDLQEINNWMASKKYMQ
jgi:hypothetical protein